MGPHKLLPVSGCIIFVEVIREVLSDLVHSPSIISGGLSTGRRPEVDKWNADWYRRSLWRNWLARSAVNRKVGGSSPPRDVSFFHKQQRILNYESLFLADVGNFASLHNIICKQSYLITLTAIRAAPCVNMCNYECRGKSAELKCYVA